MKLEFHPEAELELIEAAVYYDKQALGLGERFESEIRVLQICCSINPDRTFRRSISSEVHPEPLSLHPVLQCHNRYSTH